MHSDTKRRLRPATAIALNRKRNNKDPPNSAPNGRRLRRIASAKDRNSYQPADLNPPEWPPLLVDLHPVSPGLVTSHLVNERHIFEKTATEKEDYPRREGNGISRFPDHVDTLRTQQPGVVFKNLGRDCTETRTIDSKPPTSPSKPDEPGKYRTPEELKEFLSAAIDSVRFFLRTSSIGQARKTKEAEKDDNNSETNESDDEKDFIIPRSELLIKNAALTDKPWRFSIETYRDDPQMLEYYTGLKNYDLITSIFALVKPSEESILKWKKAETEGRYRDGAFRFGIITLLDEFFMFLFKLRNNLSLEDLAVRFSMKESIAEAILNDWLNYLYVCFGRNPVWASRDNTDIFMPTCFKALSPCARIVIHVARISVRTSGRVDIKPTPPYSRSIQGQINEQNSAPNSDDGSLARTHRKSQSRSQTTGGENKRTNVSKQRAFQKKSMNSFYNKSINIKDLTGDESTTKKVSDNVSPSKGSINTSQFISTDADDMKHFKSMVIFQPTGAAALIGPLYPLNYKSEDILLESGVLDLLEECDDILTLDPRDDLDQNAIEEMLHPYAANYMNSECLAGNMSAEELQSRSPLKAHSLKCMHWHVYHSIEWIERMKIWDELAELPETWQRNVERLWTISCLLSNFLPADPCLEFGKAG